MSKPVSGSLLSMTFFFLAASTTLAAAPTVQKLNTGWSFRLAPDEAARADHPWAAEWMKATVPGTTQSDLLALKKLPDPYVSDNEAKVQWVGLSDWQYQTEITVSEETLKRDHVELVFDGLDTFAEVSVNGTKVLAANNMFRGWRVPVKGMLKAGVNTITVDLDSPLKKMKPLVADMPYVMPGAYDSLFGDEPLGRNSSTYVRKAGYHYGWDWGPRIVTLGVWKPVKLEAWDNARLADFHVAQLHLDDTVAALNASFDIQSDKVQTVRVRTDITAPDGTVKTVTHDASLFPGLTPVTVPVQIENPQRWWPVGLGKPNLYTVKATVYQGDEVIGEHTRRIGLRTTEIRRQKDQWGQSFELVINGVPVFAKGANLIPFDMIPTRVTPAQQDHILQSAVDANMNMLRIWGGGTYQDDHVYDKADELGLMIWQDFMFGGAIIPYDRDFRENTRVEAVEQVKRLRNHPSIVIWAGNNEVQTDWENWGGGTAELKKTATPEERDRIVTGMVRMFDQVLRGAVDQNAPGTPYWASSPSTDYDGPADQDSDGDRHYWSVWGGSKPVEEYLNVTPRFMSEYGLQSFPVMATIRSFATDKDMAPEAPVMRGHQKFDKGNGNKRLMLYIENNYGTPKTFEDFVYLSQLMQADGIELAGLHHRAMRPRTMGSLYWQMNDVWPGASWSSIDYYGRWKALNYRAKRFYAPLAVGALRRDGMTELNLLSDLTADKAVTWRVRVVDFTGKTIREKTGQATVKAMTSVVAAKFSDADLFDGVDAKSAQAVVEVLDGQTVIAKTHTYATATKSLNWTDPKLTWQLKAAAGGFDLTLSAKAAARGVWIDTGTVKAQLSDNSFDLAGGETVTVRIQTDASVAALKKALTVKSYYNSAKVN
ncbi:MULTISPECIES: glycoside hydrolase family 2 protein [Asticcacaulis]|uniref:beta-mannosidase n=1 Tax=Asticcacaulis TaxID=76890 RepID=UPI001AEA3804|nr:MULTISPECIES: glycoside hydrolase family 2 protein [Asticcacaulis]MBP2157912.1 beta-mannosidase [Asticcacaulis solisilvae]MDR6798957.1 beta-mannosidase [Asticcacaulis sp. BE141]